jgi:hypothetical protein
MIPRLFPLLLLAWSPCRADIATVMAEANLEKRSEKAMKNAHEALKRATSAHEHGDKDRETAALAEVRESVLLAKTSLDDSGKNARRSPKYFKKAEIELRKLIRLLDNFRFVKGAEDRAPIDQLIQLGNQVHDEWIAAIMGKRPERK